MQVVVVWGPARAGMSRGIAHASGERGRSRAGRRGGEVGRAGGRAGWAARLLREHLLVVLGVGRRGGCRAVISSRVGKPCVPGAPISARSITMPKAFGTIFGLRVVGRTCGARWRPSSALACRGLCQLLIRTRSRDHHKLSSK